MIDMHRTVHTMTGEGKRAALYLRISKLPKGARTALRDDGGASYSVEDQDVRCSEMAKANGYKVVATFYDDGVSAYRSLKDRPGYGDLKTAMSAGAFDVLVFDRQDRLARDQTETLRFVADAKDAGILWHSVQHGLIDLTEPMQVLSAILRGGEAENYSASISRNQRMGNQRKRDAGLPGAGPRPFGYEKWDPKNPTSQPLREDEAELIRVGTEMILSGSARYQVMKVFRDSGIKSTNGKEWHSAKVTKLLSRWRNAGQVEYNDEPYGVAIWPAIVSVEDVRNVRTILSRGRAPGHWKTPTLLCSGIARCRCGYQLVATGSTIGRAYRCGEIIAKGKASLSPGPHVTIGAHVLDPLVRDKVLDSYFLRPASSGAGKSEAATLARLYEKREELVTDRMLAQDGYNHRPPIYSAGEASALVAKAEAGIKSVDAEIAVAAADSAHAALLHSVMGQLIQAAAAVGGAVGTEVAARLSEPDDEKRNKFTDDALMVWWRLPEFFGEGDEKRQAMKEALGKQFDALSLDDQRHLVRSLVTVVVNPGQGAGRAVVEPI